MLCITTGLTSENSWASLCCGACKLQQIAVTPTHIAASGMYCCIMQQVLSCTSIPALLCGQPHLLAVGDACIAAALLLSHGLCCANCSAIHGCRAREKINKPLLRNRRRGNDIDSLQKLQTIRQNQLDAVKVVQFLIKRERKKRDIAVSPAVFCSASCINSTRQSKAEYLTAQCLLRMFVTHVLASIVCHVE